MKQYILKDALVKEIDELDALNIFSDTTNKYNENYKCGYEDALENIRNFINTLEIKEVDLDDKDKWKNTGGFGSTWDPDSPDYYPD